MPERYALGFKGLDIRSRPFNFYPEFRAVIFSSSDQQPTCSPATRRAGSRPSGKAASAEKAEVNVAEANNDTAWE